MGLAISATAASAPGSQGPTSFLAACIARIREYTSEPSSNAKFTDAVLCKSISQAFSEVWSDLTRIRSNKIGVRFDLSIVTGTTEYILPPTLGRIVDMQELNTSGNIVRRHSPSHHRQEAFPGFLFEGNVLRLQDDPNDSYTLRLIAEPSNFVWLCNGTVTTITNDTTNNDCDIVIPAAPTTGTLDQRPNSYAGCVFRLLTSSGSGAGIIQDRTVKSYTPSTRTLVVLPDYDDVPTTPATFEIVPQGADDLLEPVALLVARRIVGTEGDNSRYKILNTEYHASLRSARLDGAAFQVINPHSMRRDTGRHPNVISSRIRRLGR